jgi:asparagine synthase (glutamine-hydrolysing)
MCGIFALLNIVNGFDALECADKIAHRGPDAHRSLNVGGHLLCFYRLAINGRDDGMQPLLHSSGSLICNGEIYNHNDLVQRSSCKRESSSDCEAVLHALNDFDPCTALQRLDGVFAFVAVLQNGHVVVGRDRFGVRPLFWGRTVQGTYAFASEAKSLLPLCQNIAQFPAGSVWNSHTEVVTKFWQMDVAGMIRCFDDKALEHRRCVRALHGTLVHAVRKRMMSDRPIGCFVSGGLDSSLIAALVVRECQRVGREPPQLFTVSLDRGTRPDLAAARKVATHLGLPLNEVTFPPEEGIRALGDVIYALETYDTTTVRASVPQYLLSRWVANNTDVRVLFSGEGADELLNGYRYMKRSPGDGETTQESLRLLRELPWYDVLRTDRTTAAFGLEVRVPFLDKHFVQTVLGCPADLLSANYGEMEKQLLRETFHELDPVLLPREILFRRKDAFSDAVGYSWVSCVQKYAKNFVTVDDGDSATPEELLFRQRFDLLFQKRCEFLEGHDRWMPKQEWFEEVITDPSARVLNC